MLFIFRNMYTKSLLFAIAILMASCGSTKDASVSGNEVSENRPDGVVARVENPRMTDNPNVKEFTDSLKVKEILTYLASDELEGRDSGSAGIETAANYIESYFESNRVKKFFSSYRDTITNYNVPAYNIVGLVPGRDKKLSEEYVIVGAHYDHVGIIGTGTADSIANGANDNASGTTTVLEIARYFGKKRKNKRSLLFVLFSAEEKGLLGSAHLAKRLKDEGLNLYTMLNFEMTGVPMQHEDYLLYLSGFELSNMAEISNEYAGENLIGFLPQAKEFQLFRRSDNFPFHQMFEVPSQTFCTFDFTNYDYYHKVEDEAFRMDFPHMAKVINKMIPVIEGIANAKEQEIKYY